MPPDAPEPLDGLSDVRVRPLEWREDIMWDQAPTPFGNYWIGGREGALTLRFGPPILPPVGEGYATEEAAQVAAQADYAARIRAALLPAEPSGAADDPPPTIAAIRAFAALAYALGREGGRPWGPSFDSGRALSASLRVDGEVVGDLTVHADGELSYWARAGEQVLSADAATPEEAGGVLARAFPAEPPARERAVVEALAWYAEQVADCRKITPGGAAARAALDRDGGKRARAALAPLAAPDPTAEGGEALELLPCPFCGSPGRIRPRGDGERVLWVASCNGPWERPFVDCGALPSTAAYPDRAMAVENWNHRADPHDALLAERNDLRTRLDAAERALGEAREAALREAEEAVRRWANNYEPGGILAREVNRAANSIAALRAPTPPESGEGGTQQTPTRSTMLGDNHAR